MEQSDSSSKRKTGLIAVLVALLCVGGAIAYLTDQEVLTNNFTVNGDWSSGGDKDIIDEPEWNKLPDVDGNEIPDAAEDIAPGDKIAKDPTVVNKLGADAWAFVEVVVPTDGNGKQLFILNDLNKNADFTLIDSTAGTDANTYVYSVKNAAIPSNDTKYVLFTSVTLDPTFTGADLADIEGAQDIVVTGYALADTSEIDDATTAWNILKA